MNAKDHEERIWKRIKHVNAKYGIMNHLPEFGPNAEWNVIMQELAEIRAWMDKEEHAKYPFVETKEEQKKREALPTNCRERDERVTKENQEQPYDDSQRSPMATKKVGLTEEEISE